MQRVPKCLEAFGVTRVSDVIGGILEVELIYYTPTPKELPREDEDATHRKVYLCLLIQGVCVEMVEYNEDGGANCATWEDESDWYTKLTVSPVRIPEVEADGMDYTVVALERKHGEFWTLVFPKAEAEYICDPALDEEFSPTACQSQADEMNQTRLGGSVKFIPRPR